MDEWGKKKNGQAYKKKQKNIIKGTTNESSNHKTSHKMKSINNNTDNYSSTHKQKMIYSKDEYEEAFEQMMRLKVLGFGGGFFKLQYDLSDEKIYITQNRDNEYTDLITLARVDHYDWIRDCGLNGGYDNGYVIVETKDTDLEELGNKATKKDIEEYYLDEKNNVRVIKEIEAYDNFDKLDIYNSDTYEISNKIEEADKNNESY